MPDFTILRSPAPYHILTYGTLLGTQFFQSFVNGIVAFRALPRAQFSTLQQAIFPVYFGMQTIMPVILALTFPGSRPIASTDFEGKVILRTNGLSALLTNENRWPVLAPLVAVAATGLVNWVVIEPLVVGIMKERKHQETRDGKRSYDAGPHSPEMKKLNSAFGKWHGISSLLNLISLLATAWHGILLSERL